MTLYFTDVVDKTKEQPLCVHLHSPSQGKAVQPMRVAQIGEHRLDDAQPAAVLMTAVIGVDLALHLVQVFLRRDSMRVPCSLLVSDADG